MTLCMADFCNLGFDHEFMKADRRMSLKDFQPDDFVARLAASSCEWPLQANCGMSLRLE
jgi:hypothetical protein